MISFFGTIGLAAACSGAGTIILKITGLLDQRSMMERIALAFAIGFGVLGWIGFWVGILGWFTPGTIWITIGLCSLGNYSLFRGCAETVVTTSARDTKTHICFYLLIAALTLAFLLDLMEALTPVVEADTLAYHFVRAREFVEQGQIEFVPIALLGAIPMLVHVTYGMALAIGDEQALTLWTFLSSWAAGFLLYAFALRWLDRNWSLATVLVFQTAPAMIYSGGSGHVEPRLALFVLVLGIAVHDGFRRRELRYAFLAGAASGFYAASKLTGLLLVAAGSIWILFGQARTSRFLTYCFAAALAGGQWYLWNLMHTGDPVFPLMFTWADRLGIANAEYWSLSHHEFMSTYLGSRSDLIDGFWTKLFYPFIATFTPPVRMESGRVGLGPIFVMLIPFAIYGMWTQRARLFDNGLFAVAITVLAFYVLWLNFGSIPKVRHVLPFVPTLILCVLVASRPYLKRWLAFPVALGFALVIFFNLGAQTLYAKSHASYFTNNMTRDEYLSHYLRGFDAVRMLNTLPDVENVYVWERHLLYHIGSAGFFAAPYQQVFIDGRPGLVEPSRFLNQLRVRGVSHILMVDSGEEYEPRTVAAAVDVLEETHCITRLETVPVRHFASRTLGAGNAQEVLIGIWKVEAEC